MYHAITKTAGPMLIVLLCSLVFAPPAEAQIWKKAKKAAERATERTVERKTAEKTEKVVGSAIDAAVDPTVGAVVCALEDRECIEQAKKEGRAVEVTDEDGTVVEEIPAEGAPASAGQPSATTAEAAAMKPGEGVWANYDFVPGNEVLFTSDFSEDNVGDFPRQLEFATGNMEVIEWQGHPYLRATAQSAFRIPLPKTLPDRFTIEFDAHNPSREWLALMTAPDELERNPMNYNGYPGSYFLIEAGRAGMEGQGPETKTQTRALTEGMVPVRIMVDGSYAKMYLGEQRVVNIPNASIVRGSALHLILYYANPDQPTYVGNIRVAAGGKDLYDRLESEGRVATQGVFFDTGSASIRPESTPTLKEMGQMLEQHADLRLRIEGHTDNEGSAATNKALSQQRAEAVKAYLVSEHGVDTSRLEAVGVGQEQPVADNGTPEGKQSNRRVELVQL